MCSSMRNAIKDPIVTLAAYLVMREEAIGLMEAYGYDSAGRN